jgi:hypothetical protein
METVEFGDVEVVAVTGTDLVCGVAETRVAVPLMLVLPGSGVWQRGDRGPLVIPKWLAIGLGLVSPAA